MHTVERVVVPNLDPSRISEIRSNTLGSLGECPTAIDRLLEHALYAESLGASSERYLAVVPKIRPYSALDFMIMAADEHQVIPSIAAMETAELQQQCVLASKLFTAYETLPEKETNPIVLRALAVNYDAWPSDADLLPKRAQSIPTEHLHVFSYTLDEFQHSDLVPASELTKREQRRYFDPMSGYISSLLQLFAIGSAMEEGMLSMHSEAHPEYEGVTFMYEGSISDSRFAHDLQKLHKNGEKLFEQISAFLNPETTDETGMPVRKTKVQQLDRLQYFLEMYPATTPEEVAIHQQLRRRSEWMIQRLFPSHLAKVTAANRFHEEYAYTLLATQRVGSSSWIVNLTPRVISDGNALATLRQYRVPSTEPTPEEHYENITTLHNWVRRSILQQNTRV